MVAIGGGSSLDCAKGINFVLTNGGDISDYRGYGKVSTPLLPMIGIPTTAGTGTLTARFDLPHGLALAILLPHVVRWNAAIAGDGYRALVGSPSRGARDPDAAETLAARLEGFGRIGGMPARLSDAGVPRDTLPSFAELAGQQWTGTFNPRPFDASGALEIYEACF